MNLLKRIFQRNPLLVKKPSPIHGTGIFATRDIRKGETFYEIPLEQLFHEPHARCARIGTRLWVSDEKVLNYVNHSCSPNTVLFTNRFYGSFPRLRALYPIKAGEEITVNYNWTEGPDGTPLKCNCQSPSCKGYFLVAESENEEKNQTPKQNT